MQRSHKQIVLNAETALLLGHEFELLAYPVDGFADLGRRVVLQHHQVTFGSWGDPAKTPPHTHTSASAALLAFAVEDLSHL